jgi:hypothetical protein
VTRIEVPVVNADSEKIAAMPASVARPRGYAIDVATAEFYAGRTIYE